MNLLLIALFLIVVSLVFLGVKHVPEPERLVVFRLGKVNRLAGPGVVWLLPSIDRGWRVNLDEAVPEWRSLDAPELISRLIEYGGQPAPSVGQRSLLGRLWKDNAFQFGVCLLLLAVGCSAFLLFSQPERSDLVAISGRIERIQGRIGGRYSPSKLILFIRTPTKVVQVNTKPYVDRNGTLAPGQPVTALVSYEDALGRDIAFLYELTRGSDVLLTYDEKVAEDAAKNRFIVGLAPYFAAAGSLLCAIRWRKFT
jgi:hypothetical protein